GDGTTSLMGHPYHSYTEPGVYTVSLTATLDNCSVTVTTTLDVTFPTGVAAHEGTGVRVCGGREAVVVGHGPGGGRLRIEGFDAAGRLWFAKDYAAVPGQILVPARDIAAGVWIVRLTRDGLQRSYPVPMMR